jgi:pilus assembly protein FimV
MLVTSIEVPEGGTVGNRTITTRLLALLTLALLPLEVPAAGLGRLAVLSGLGQPLRAEIEVVSLQRAEAESLSAKIATPDAFRDAGVDYGAVVPRVRTALERRPNDRYVIVLSTPQPVEEPFLDLLVELNWASGRLVRQYTFLLDPVDYRGPQPIAAAPAKPAVTEVRPVDAPRLPEVSAAAPAAPVATPPAASAEPAPTAAPTPAETPAAQPPAEPAAAAPASATPAPATPAPTAPAPAAAAARASEPAATYEVQKGDTLSKVAQQYRPEGVTLQQMLVALYRANEEAFIRKNMNLVRAGRVLTIPDREAVDVIAAADAGRIVVAQWQDFNDYRAQLGGAIAAAPARTEPPQQQRAAGQITEQPEATAAAPKAAPRDELRISKADQAAKGAKAAAAGRADDLAARERALQEANSRVGDLERNVKDLQGLVELKSKQLADLQKQAEAAKAATAKAADAQAAKAATAKAADAQAAKAAAAAKVADAEAAKAAAAKAAEAEAAKAAAAKAAEAEAAKAAAAAAAKAPEPAKAVEVAKAPEAPKAAEPAPAAPPKPEAPKAEAPKPPAPPKAAAAPKKPAPPPPPEPSLVEAILDEPLYLAGGGGGILALLIGGYLWRRKRSAKLENSLLGVTTTDSSSVFGTTGGRSVDTGGSSLQTDFSQSGIGAIDTDEVDPVAEADVYMAYGRDAQAEEILKEALLKDPNRQTVRVKLLEIYAARKDLKAFETTAGEIYAATGGQGPEWQKAVELGLSIDASNPMYGGGGARRETGGRAPERDTVVLPAAGGAAGGAAAAMASDLAFDLADGKAPPSIDFDLGGGGRAAGPAVPDLALDVASQAPADLGFDLNLGGDSQKPAVEEASDFSPSGTFIMDAATKKAVSDMVEAQGAAPGSLEIDFELPGTKGGAAPGEQTARMQAAQPANVTEVDFKLGEPTKPAASAMDLGGISFDLGKGGGEGAPVDARWQEVATKLDLAKAYEEMGDKDGARELLNEVLKEGDAAQQQQAKQMLAAIR